MSTPNNWFLKTNTGKIHGPYSEPQIREALYQGRFEAGSLIRQGNSRWFTLAELTEVFNRLAETGWYLAEANGVVSGPFTLTRLKSLLAGRDCSRLQVCQGTSGTWILASQWIRDNVQQPQAQQVYPVSAQPVVTSTKASSSQTYRRIRRRKRWTLWKISLMVLLPAILAGGYFAWTGNISLFLSIDAKQNDRPATREVPENGGLKGILMAYAILERISRKIGDAPVSDSERDFWVGFNFPKFKSELESELANRPEQLNDPETLRLYNSMKATLERVEDQRELWSAFQGLF